MEIDKKAVGMRISQIRREKGLTLEEFGKIIDGAGKSAVSKWERGDNIPSNKRLKIISNIGNTSLDTLLYGSLSNFIHKNFKDLLPPKARSFAGMDDISELVHELEEDNVKISDIEKIKITISNKIPIWKEKYRKEKEKDLEYITNNKNYLHDVKEHYSAPTKSELKIIDKIFKEGESFSFDDMDKYGGKIEEIYSALKLVTGERTYFTDTFAPVLDDNYFLNNINDLEIKIKDKEKEHIYFKMEMKPLPYSKENHEILVNIKKNSQCSFLKKDCSILLQYIPKMNESLLKEYFIKSHITIVIKDEIYLGYLNSDFIFCSMKNNTDFYLDLKDNSVKYNIFPTLAVFF